VSKALRQCNASPHTQLSGLACTGCKEVSTFPHYFLSTASRSRDRCAGNLRGSPQTRRIQRSLRRDDWYANIRDKKPLVPFRWNMSPFLSAVLSANLRNCEAVGAV
jgi:hypothetical protein